MLVSLGGDPRPAAPLRRSRVDLVSRRRAGAGSRSRRKLPGEHHIADRDGLPTKCLSRPGAPLDYCFVAIHFDQRIAI